MSPPTRSRTWPRAASPAARSIIVGEDYGEGSSIMQERSHAFAMKSQIWLLDPRPNLESIVEMVEHGFELSEASTRR
jgi:TPP-dependent indolepyruvate ferredoxin oxidoreductase alpha subunit